MAVTPGSASDWLAQARSARSPSPRPAARPSSVNVRGLRDCPRSRSDFPAALDAFASAWERGETPGVDDFVQLLDPADSQGAVELIYREFCLAEAAGRSPDPRCISPVSAAPRRRSSGCCRCTTSARPRCWAAGSTARRRARSAGGRRRDRALLPAPRARARQLRPGLSGRADEPRKSSGRGQGLDPDRLASPGCWPACGTPTSSRSFRTPWSTTGHFT